MEGKFLFECFNFLIVFSQLLVFYYNWHIFALFSFLYEVIFSALKPRLPLPIEISKNFFRYIFCSLNIVQLIIKSIVYVKNYAHSQDFNEYDWRKMKILAGYLSLVLKVNCKYVCSNWNKICQKLTELY